MFVFIDYLVDSLVLQEYVLKGVSSVVSTSPPKWLNIVLDINGILYHCMEKAATRGMLFVNDVKQGIHSPTVSTIIEAKAVFTRPGLHEFFTTISEFAARVLIWSSMKRSTKEKIVQYLFCGLQPPFDILGQDSCWRIETSRGKYMTVIGGSKEIFLKVLLEKLFIGSKRMDSQNTILIDENPEKCMCNDTGNYLFLETWNPLDASEDFLLHTLAPWLLNVHKNCGPGQLRDFVNRERIGVRPLAKDCEVVLHIGKGMALSSKNVWAKYEVLGVPGFVMPKMK
jgi:hypothetical protein